MSMEQLSIPLSSSGDEQEVQPKKNKLRGFLKAAFMGAVVTGGIRYLAKSTSSLAGLTGPAGIALAAVSSGLALTAWGMLSEYRDMCKEMDNKDALREIVSKKSLKKHGIKMLFNTASAAIGAFSFIGADFLLDNTSAGGWIKDTAKDWFLPLFGITKPDVLVSSESLTIEPIVEEVVSIPLTPIEQVVESISVQEGVGVEFLTALEKAKNGNISALKDVAVYLFNGTDALPDRMQKGFEGVTQNKELAILLYQQAADAGSVSAQADLDYIEKRGWIPEKQDIVVDAGLDNSMPDVSNISSAVGELITEMHDSDLSADAQKIYDGLLSGENWALESAGTGVLNGSYGLPNISEASAVAMIEQASEQGSVNAQIDLAYFQYHGLHGVEIDKAKALEIINNLGQSWAGGEELLKPEGERVALCDVFEDSNKANCDISNEQIKGGDYVEMKNYDGMVNRFYLDGDAETLETKSFVSKRIVDVLTLSTSR